MHWTCRGHEVDLAMMPGHYQKGERLNAAPAEAMDERQCFNTSISGLFPLSGRLKSPNSTL